MEFQGRISICSQDIGLKGHFGCQLGSILAFWDLNEIRTPNHFYGSGMATFMGEEHGFLFQIMTKMAILAVHWAQFGHFGIQQDYKPKLLSWQWNGRIFVGTAWFQGHISLCFQDICQKGHFWLPRVGLNMGILESEQDKTPNYFHGSGMPHSWGYSMF